MVRSGLVCLSKKGICLSHETNKQIGVPSTSELRKTVTVSQLIYQD